MNRLGFLVLSILKTNGATTKFSSMSVREMTETEDCGYKENTIFKNVIHTNRSLRMFLINSQETIQLPIKSSKNFTIQAYVKLGLKVIK